MEITSVVPSVIRVCIIVKENDRAPLQPPSYVSRVGVAGHVPCGCGSCDVMCHMGNSVGAERTNCRLGRSEGIFG